MSDSIEKIYCCDRGDNDNALAAAILTQRIFRANGWNWNGCGCGNNCGCGNGCGC
jgi:hypothetical protein